jgi:hypothetical protein
MMARTSVVTQAMALAGLAPVLTAPTADGDVVDVGRNFLMVENIGVGAVTVTVQTPGGTEDLALADRVVNVAAGTVKLIPLTMPAYRQPVSSDDAGRAYVDYSVPADINRGVISL